MSRGGDGYYKDAPQDEIRNGITSCAIPLCPNAPSTWVMDNRRRAPERVRVCATHANISLAPLPEPCVDAVATRVLRVVQRDPGKFTIPELADAIGANKKRVRAAVDELGLEMRFGLIYLPDNHHFRTFMPPKEIEMAPEFPRKSGESYREQFIRACLAKPGLTPGEYAKLTGYKNISAVIHEMVKRKELIRNTSKSGMFTYDLAPKFVAGLVLLDEKEEQEAQDAPDEDTAPKTVSPPEVPVPPVKRTGLLEPDEDGVLRITKGTVIENTPPEGIRLPTNDPKIQQPHKVLKMSDLSPQIQNRAHQLIEEIPNVNPVRAARLHMELEHKRLQEEVAKLADELEQKRGKLAVGTDLLESLRKYETM